MCNNLNFMLTSSKVLAALMLLGVPVAHATDGFSIGTGVNATSGKYGTSTTTDIWSVPFTGTYQSGRWTFALAVPYISISGSGDVIPGTGLVNNQNPLGRGLDNLLGVNSLSNPGSSAAKKSGSAAGLGDVVASAGYMVVSSADRSFGLALTGKVKFGTADANKGLGTGQNDYGVSLDSYKVFGKWTPFGGVGWMNYGSSAYIKLNNGINTNAGVDYQVASSDSVGTYYNYREPITVGGASQSQYTAYWNHKFSDSLHMQSYALGGTTNASPDWGLGASINYNF